MSSLVTRIAGEASRAISGSVTRPAFRFGLAEAEFMRHRPVDEILEALTVLGRPGLGRPHQDIRHVNRGAHKSILASSIGDVVAVLLVDVTSPGPDIVASDVTMGIRLAPRRGAAI